MSESGGNATKAAVRDFAYLVVGDIEDFQLGILKQSVRQKS